MKYYLKFIIIIFFFSKFNTYIEEKLITSPIKRSNLQRNFSYIFHTFITYDNTATHSSHCSTFYPFKSRITPIPKGASANRNENLISTRNNIIHIIPILSRGNYLSVALSSFHLCLWIICLRLIELLQHNKLDFASLYPGQ